MKLRFQIVQYALYITSCRLYFLVKSAPFFTAATAALAAINSEIGSMIYPFNTSDKRSMMIAPALPIKIVSIFFRRAQIPLYLSAHTSSCVFNLASKSSTTYPFSFCSNFYPRLIRFVPVIHFAINRHCYWWLPLSIFVQSPTCIRLRRNKRINV